MSMLRSSLGLAQRRLKHAYLSAIANNYFVKKIETFAREIIIEDSCHTLKKLCLSLILVLPISSQAITITNSATVSSDIGIFSSSVDMTTVLPPTPSSIVVYQYAPTATGTSSIPVPLGEYSPGGSLAGPFNPLPQPTTLTGVPIAVPANLDLLPVNVVKGGEPLFIEVTDLNNNTSSVVVETVVVELVTASGDRVVIRLTETGANTGIFIGYIQTSLSPSALDDTVLTVATEEIISATYIDSYDNTDSSNVNVLVDPYGIVFDSATGSPVDGVQITLIDTATGLPATVLGDDGISIYPSTLTTGGSATDSSGTVYNFPPGVYRFPLIAPGNYRYDIVTPLSFNAPSAVPTVDLQALPGAPFTIVAGSRGEDFVINPGPPVRIDIPVDVDNGSLFLVKRSTKDQVGLGEFLQYSIQVNNTRLGSIDTVQLTDTLPEGFRYQEGTATFGGSPIPDPVISNDARTLLFDLGTIASATSSDLKYIVSVSAGATPGYAINQVIGTALGGITSNTAEATVVVQDDFMRSESIVMGRVLLEVCEADGPPEGQVALTLHTETDKKQVLHTLKLGVESVPVKDMVLEVRLPGALEYQSGSASLNGKSIPDPDIFGGQLKFKLGDLEADTKTKLKFQTHPKGIVFGEFQIRAVALFKSETGMAQNTPLAENLIRDYSRILRPRFDTLSAELKSQDKRELDKLINDLRGHAIAKVSIMGHSDNRKIRARSRSKYANNAELSFARANSVANYLKEQLQLNDDQIEVIGKGDSRPVYYNKDIEKEVLSRAEKLALSRRVEVLVEMANTESRFLIEKADSGKQSVHTLGQENENKVAGLGLGKDGVSNVRLYLEDGRYIDTDEYGQYHFEGLKPGTHLVQVDTDSLPEHLEIYTCEKNTRFAGTPYSQFVDTQGGSLWRADFHVRRKLTETSLHNVGLQLTSRMAGDKIFYQLQLNSQFNKLESEKLFFELPSGLEFIHNSAQLNGTKLANPEVAGKNLIFHLENENLKNNNDLSFEVKIINAEEGEYISSAVLSVESNNKEVYKTDRVDNTLVRQYTNQDKKIFSTTFDAFDIDLSEKQQQSVEGLIDYLQGKNIRLLHIVGYANEITRTQKGGKGGATIFNSNEVLASERAKNLKQYLVKNLRLLPEQIKISGYSRLDLSGKNGRYLEVLATLANEEKKQNIRIVQNDSGFKTSSFQYVDRDIASEKINEEQNKPENNTKTGFLTLVEGMSQSAPVGNVTLQMDSRLKPVLLVDGKPVPKFRIGTKSVNKDTRLTFYNYIGVNFGEPGEHTITIKGMGPFGNARFEQSINYIRTGEIAEIQVVNVEGNIADGKTPVKVTLALLDKAGNVIKGAADLLQTGGDLKPYLENDEQNKSERYAEITKKQNLISVKPNGEVIFDPVSTSGTHTATLEYNDASIDIATYVKPHYRDWIMVGLAESTLGYNNLKDNMQSLEDADIEEHFYDEGRLAFFSKGKILGKYLLTLAYDSDREKEDANNGLFGTIDPGKYYTLYGDNGEVAHDAPSTEKLYLKLEGDKFYTLFGDYNTGLTVTELSRYSRSLTGFKGEYKGKHISAQIFAAENNQAFIKDEIQGDGTSGLYHLSHQNIVLNSEKITLEIRDRFRSHEVLETRSLQRYIDYNLDPVSGTIYFKEPIYSRDQNLNQIYIVVDYETQNSNDDSITAGGRVALSLDKKGSEVGVTIIQDDTIGAENELVGADFKYKIKQDTEIKLELAETTGLTAGNNVSGKAYLAEATHNGKGVKGKVYAREQQGEFGLGQQKGSENASRKIGIEASTDIKENLSLDSEIYRDVNLSTKAVREMINVSTELKKENYKASVGIRHARDRYTDGKQLDSSMLTTSASRNLMENRLIARTNLEVALGDNENPDYPTRLLGGLDYALTGNINVFAEQEYTFGEYRHTQNTRMGLKSSPWTGAQINTNIEQQLDENGPRRFANYGLTQTWDVNQALKIDAGLDRSISLNEVEAPATFNLNTPPASGPAREDFTAISTGASYKKEYWSMMTRLERRDADQEDKTGILMGFYRQQGEGIGLSSELTYFGTRAENGNKTTEAEFEISVAYRPINSQWIILNKSLFSETQIEDAIFEAISNKFVNNLNTNYLFNRANQLSLSHGYKKVKDNYDTESYTGTTQFLGAEYRHDFNARWDAGLQTSLLFSDVAENRQYSYGASIGYNVARNMWFSVGYNIKGFKDEDFSAASYSARGPYMKFRIAFDHLVSREALAWWEKRK